VTETVAQLLYEARARPPAPLAAETADALAAGALVVDTRLPQRHRPRGGFQRGRRPDCPSGEARRGILT